MLRCQIIKSIANASAGTIIHATSFQEGKRHCRRTLSKTSNMMPPNNMR